MRVRKQGDTVGFIHVPVSVKALGESPDHYAALFLIDTGAIDSMAPSSELRRAGIDDSEPFLGVTALEAAGVTIDPSTQTLRKLPAVRL
jgi:predicted aspartyl protease